MISIADRKLLPSRFSLIAQFVIRTKTCYKKTAKEYPTVTSQLK